MTEKKREIASLTTDISETAASAHNRLYKSSGAMMYRVILAQAGGARTSTTVEAETGDRAAEMALAKNPGWKVAHVGPASDAGVVSDDLAGE